MHVRASRIGAALAAVSATLAIAAAPASARTQGGFFCQVNGPCEAVALPAGLPDLAQMFGTTAFTLCSGFGGGLSEPISGVGTVQLCDTATPATAAGGQGTVIGELTIAPLDTGVAIDAANDGPSDPCGGSIGFGALDIMGVGGALGLDSVNIPPSNCSITPVTTPLPS